MAPVNSTLSEPVKQKASKGKDKTFIRLLEPGTDLGCVQVGRSLGFGTFGRVYSGIVSSADLWFDVAIKVCDTEPTRAACLQQEAQMLRELQGIARVPMLFYCFRHKDLYVMVLNLLGPSLEEHWQQRGKKIGAARVGYFGRQLISALRHVHGRGIIHRDVKPSNILLEVDEVEPQLCLADFGLATFYRVHEHVPFSDKRHFVGSRIYASVNAHSKVRLSRRDDMESLLYTLLFLLAGPLPWEVDDGAMGRKVRLTHKEFLQYKASDKVRALCEPHGSCWVKLFGLCRDVEYVEEPDYDAMRSLMRSLSQGEDAMGFELSTSIPSDCYSSEGSKASTEELVPAERWEYKLSL